MNIHLPVTYSILSVRVLISDILPDYSLGDIADCKFFMTGFNDTYIVKTTEGSTYYFRIYRLGWRSLSNIEYELDVLNHLHSKGVSAARPLPRKGGSFIWELSAPEGRRYAVLFTAAEGKEISYDKDPERMAFKYGKAVATIHNAVQDFTSRHIRFHIDLDHLIDTPLRNIEPVLSPRSDDWAYVQRFAGTVRQRILEIPADELEQGFCHGDLQGYHANVDGNGKLTFYDFDGGGYGYRAYDLAVFKWCARLKEQEKVWWEPYLRGYREERFVNDLDLHAIPLFICARHIWHMGVHTGNASDWGYGGLSDTYFDERLRWLRSLETDYLK
jgi:Ser/Thr protein kinase RdoA (MazF antagonist)